MNGGELVRVRGRGGRGGPGQLGVQAQQREPEGDDVMAIVECPGSAQRRAPDHVLEFAHVARPRVGKQGALGVCV